MKSIRCGSGFGDSLYLQSVVRHLLLRNGHPKMVVASNWPDVFRPLRDRVHVIPFTRQVNIVAHYVPRKGIRGTTQFQDCCLRAGIIEPAELRLDWTVVNEGLVAKLRDVGRPVLVVQLPRVPMGRADGFGRSLLPNCKAIQRLLDQHKETHYVVQIGAGEPLYHFQGIDLDLSNRTSIAEVIDVASAADRFLGYVSFLVPLAESFAKPATFVWSALGLRDPLPFIRQIRPEKVLHLPSSHAVIDEEVLRGKAIPSLAQAPI